MFDPLRSFQVIALNTYAAGKYSGLAHVSQDEFWIETVKLPFDNLFHFIMDEVDPSPQRVNCQSMEAAKYNLLQALIRCGILLAMFDQYEDAEPDPRIGTFINPLQAFALKSYAGARYSYLAYFTSEEHFNMELDSHADDFIAFLVEDFSAKLGRFSKAEAIKRLKRAEFEITQVWQALVLLGGRDED